MDVIESMKREIEEMQDDAENVNVEGESVIKGPVKPSTEDAKNALCFEENFAHKMKGEVNNAVDAYRLDDNISSKDDKTEAVKATVTGVELANGDTAVHENDIEANAAAMNMNRQRKRVKAGAPSRKRRVYRRVEELPMLDKETIILFYIKEAEDSVPVKESDVIDVIDHDATPEFIETVFNNGENKILYQMRVESMELKQRHLDCRRLDKPTREMFLRQIEEFHSEDNFKVPLHPKEEKNDIQAGNENTEPVSAPVMPIQARPKKGIRARFVRRIHRLFGYFKPKNFDDE